METKNRLTKAQKFEFFCLKTKVICMFIGKAINSNLDLSNSIQTTVNVVRLFNALNKYWMKDYVTTKELSNIKKFLDSGIEVPCPIRYFKELPAEDVERLVNSRKKKNELHLNIVIFLDWARKNVTESSDELLGFGYYKNPNH